MIYFALRQSYSIVVSFLKVRTSTEFERYVIVCRMLRHIHLHKRKLFCVCSIYFFKFSIAKKHVVELLA